jgi:hypothetical protein
VLAKVRFFPLIAVLLVAAWQWSTVHANYGGNWTALYCTGALLPHPPLVEAEHIYVFPNSTGYDGQLYHYVAHDPLLRHGMQAYVDDARLRYRRILVPLLAYALALGHSKWIDPAYEFVFLLSVALGVYWSCRVAKAWGLLFLLIPAVPIMVDRLVVDGALAALTAGFICYRDGPRWKLLLILVCAALTRETGFLLIAAAFLWRPALLTAATALPALSWYGYVASQTPHTSYAFSWIPLSGIAHVLVHPWQYPTGTPFPEVLVAADYLAVAGALLAMGLAFYLVRTVRDPVTLAAALFAALGLIVQRPDLWENVYDIGRLQSPLLLCLAAIAALERQPWLLLPLAMILPRLAMQFAPQVLGVIQKAAG